MNEEGPLYFCPLCQAPMAFTCCPPLSGDSDGTFTLVCDDCDLASTSCGWDGTEEAIQEAHEDLLPAVQTMARAAPFQNAIRGVREEFESLFGMVPKGSHPIGCDPDGIRRRFLDHWRRLVRATRELLEEAE